MAKPVVIDDGGSLRIRELQDYVQMDGLIGVGDPLVFSSPSNQNFVTGKHFLCTLTVTSLADDGAISVVPFSDGLYGHALKQTDTVTVTTTDAHTAIVTFDAKGVLNILLSLSASGSEGAARRRYIAATAGTIQNVKYARDGKSVPIFDAGATTAITTIVHFGPQAPRALELMHPKC